MVQDSYFNRAEKEASEEEIRAVGYTAISILGSMIMAFVLLMIYFIM